MTGTLPTFRVSEVCSRNLLGGSDKTLFRVVIDASAESGNKLVDFDVVDDWNSPFSGLNYARRELQKITALSCISAAGLSAELTCSI